MPSHVSIVRGMELLWRGHQQGGSILQLANGEAC